MTLSMKILKLLALIGEEPHTPIDKALRTTLAELGCIQNAG